MSDIKEGGSTAKQMAYAKLIMAGEMETKKEMALAAGYSETSADSTVFHIESKPGFRNAMLQLATEANNLLLDVMKEFKNRTFKDFDDKQLVNALNTISAVSSTFNDAVISTSKLQDEEETKGNKLRKVILQQVENQTIVQGDSIKFARSKKPIGSDVLSKEELKEINEVKDDF